MLKALEPRRGANQGGKNIHTGTDTNVREAPTRTQAASDAGLSKYQKDTALRVANVDRELFETLVESEDPPTTRTHAQLLVVPQSH